MAHLFAALANAIFGRPRARKATRTPRRVVLGLEVLEGRALPSVSPIFTFAAPTQVAQMPPPQVVDVPNLQGYSFHLISSNGKPAHDLVIQSETYNADGSASFTGTWAGEGPNGTGTPKPISNGTLKYDATGNILLSFSWTNGSGGQNTFSGVLTRINTGPMAAVTYFGAHYHLEGDVTASTPGDGPGHISGDSQSPAPVMKATF